MHNAMQQGADSPTNMMARLAKRLGYVVGALDK